MSWITGRLRERRNLQQVVGNSGWLFIDWTFRSAAGLAVGIWVARYLGPADYGALNYAVAFVSLFTAVATLGLDTIVVRDVTRAPERKDTILGTAFVLRFAAACLAAAASFVCIALLKPHNPRVWQLVAAIAAGMLFQSFDVIDFWFQAQIRSKYSVYARSGGVALAMLGRIALIAVGAPLLAFAIVSSAELAMIAAGLAAAYLMTGNRLRSWSFSSSESAALLRNAWPLIVSTVAVYVQARIDQVMLGEMLGDAEVGQYSVAMRLIEAASFVPMIIYSSVAPTVTQAKLRGEEHYLERLKNIYRLMFIVFLLTAVPTFLLAGWLVPLVYGEAYRQAGLLLALFAPRLLFANFGVARSLFITNDNLFTHALLASVTGAVVNVALNYWLIPPYRSVGAIVAMIVSFTVTIFLFDLFSRRARTNLALMLSAMMSPWRLQLT